MLMGEYAHTIDAKGRVILPADFRAELGEHFFIVKGLDQCLYIYGENEWASFVQKVRQLPDTKPETRRLVRHFFSSGRELECDRQGRFLVPGNLRSYANLGKDVVLAGALKRVEVWSKDEWERYNAMEEEDREQFTASMAELGI